MRHQEGQEPVTPMFAKWLATKMQYLNSITCVHLLLQVEDAAGRVKTGEREFLISPVLGSVTMTAAGYLQPPDSRFATAKKPFDWMTEDQFNNLQVMALHYEWFQV